MSNINEEEEEALAYHECAHAVFGAMVGVSVWNITLIDDAHVQFTPGSVLRLMFDDNARAIVFMAGIAIQRHYFPNSDITCRRDRAVLRGLSERRRKKYQDYFQRELRKPEVRGKVEQLARELLIHKFLNGKQIQDILNGQHEP